MTEGIKKYETSVPLTNQNCIHGEIQSRFREFLLPFDPKSFVLPFAVYKYKG
jgi:hypothetical protein